MLIAASRAVTPTRVLAPGWLRLAGPQIVEVGSGWGRPPEVPDVTVVGTVAPGFVDTHVDGVGRSFSEGTVGNGGGSHFAAACSLHLPGPDLPESIAPLGAVIPAQLAIEEAARRMGLDPDSPRRAGQGHQTESVDTSQNHERNNL